VLETLRRECRHYAGLREDLREPLAALEQLTALLVQLGVTAPMPQVVLSDEVPLPRRQPALLGFAPEAGSAYVACATAIVDDPCWQEVSPGAVDRDTLISAIKVLGPAFLNSPDATERRLCAVFGAEVAEAATTLLRLASVPLYLRAVEELGPMDLSHWNSGRCPRCGERTSYARLTSDPPRRFLFCSRCWGEWEYPRIGCVACGSQDPERLGYFYGEDDQAHRVYTCEQCHGYLKVTDERAEGRQVSPLVEDYVTSRLDEEAIQQGYANSSPSNRSPVSRENGAW